MGNRTKIVLVVSLFLVLVVIVKILDHKIETTKGDSGEQSSTSGLATDDSNGTTDDANDTTPAAAPSGSDPNAQDGDTDGQDWQLNAKPESDRIGNIAREEFEPVDDGSSRVATDDTASEDANLDYLRRVDRDDFGSGRLPGASVDDYQDEAVTDTGATTSGGDIADPDRLLAEMLGNTPKETERSSPESSGSAHDVTRDSGIVPASVKPEFGKPQRASDGKTGPTVPAPARTHVVVDGDTLWDLAVAYYKNGMRYKDILAANGLREDDHLKVGMKLEIPAISAASTAATIESPPAAVDSATQYVVKKGDSLYAIAKARLGSGGRWNEIEALNPGIDPDALTVGTCLKMPKK